MGASLWFLGREMLSVGARQGAGPDVILGAVRGKWIVGGKDISREAGWETRVGELHSPLTGGLVLS